MIRRTLLLSTVSAIAAVALASPALAHIDPDPTEAQAGSTLSVAFTVEHGCDGSPTIQLDMRLPDGVTDARPDAIAGWEGSIDADVVTFAGGPLPDDQEGTFSVTMTLPPTPDTTVYFPFVQRCEVGEIRWIAIPTDDSGAEPEEPAPALLLTGPVATTTTPATTGHDRAGHDRNRIDGGTDDSRTGNDGRRFRGVDRCARRRPTWRLPVSTRTARRTPAPGSSLRRSPPCSDSARSSRCELAAPAEPAKPAEPMVRQIVIRRWLVAVAAIIGAIGTLGMASGTALAHAELTSSNPANQAILAVQPSEIVLTFSEDVDTVGDSIRLVDADGKPAPLGPVDQSLGKNTLRAPVAIIADGTYIVGWQAISADSHKIRGAFTFSVGAATPTAPGVIDEIFDAGGTAQSDSLLLGVGRFLSYAGIGGLLGALFLAAMLVPELIGERRIGRLLVAAALTAVVGTAAMFVAQAHLISGSYFTWDEVVQIQSGQWWLARLAAIGLFALFIPARSFLASTPGRVELALASLVVCGVVAAGGHAVAGDIVVAGFVSTVFHLAAMSIWVGGLALLAFGVPRNWFWWTASQFSPWALGAVVALALTGSVNAWRQLGSLSGLTDSSYGRWLVVKLMLVVFVVGVAFFSRRMARSDDEDEAEAANERPRTTTRTNRSWMSPSVISRQQWPVRRRRPRSCSAAPCWRKSPASHSS